ncbi:nitrate- and nitrite sensing domain-containing protein [Micromonospora sp. WMMD975]|uniref:nitrate- and nitrite sensing domain-containing protein n=1 Tax=Micromonospora sp. WMMD975 TaxID=3016087 RepID=UPI00249BEF21|nr:nitrate- and nitrite sensing domain-containing protein [Micromonospora sp. WMMD975]WFE32162.1 nitrate- and nitrite sensing domain-containing protein [Micromonospora sp. WMMD975]
MSTRPTTLPGSPNADQRNRRRRLPRLRDARIRSKLALILVVPVAAVIALATIRLISVGQGAYDANQVRALTAVSVDVSALTQDLHKERMAASAFLVDPNQKPDAYNLRVRQTDERIAAYREERGTLGDLPAAVRDRLKVIDDHLETLNGTRQEVLDRAQMPVAEASLRYGIVLDDLVAYGDTLAQLPGAEDLADARRAVAAFAHAKAEVAEEQAVAFTALAASKRIDEEQFSSFVATLTGQQEALLSFSRAAAPDQRALVDRTVSGDAVQLADRMAADLTRSVGKAALVDRDEVSAAVGAVDDLMRWAEIQLLDELLADADAARSDVIRQAIVESLLVLLTLAVAVTLAVVLARSLNDSLRRLREGALAVANHDLPDAVSRLQNVNAIGDGGVDEIVQQVRDPIKLTNRDEVGQVAVAFNVVHREAVRVAAEQAALRTSVSAMFLNLARRSQSLVDRMIGELDAIERGEEDPKRLAQLFELDHLATRMRRNDENLLVLAGADSAVPRRDDALLVDVLRAAQSEVELYNRIEFGTVDTDISVAAHAVNDVVRLVAELLDNASRFSPPNTVVVADGRRIRDYVLIQVEDRGLGLTDDQLDSLNRRLAAPPTVDVAAFRLMGLAVVSRLASRYGIRVELRRNVEGGTVAQVTLPNSTVVLPANRGQAPLTRPRQPLAVEPSPLSQVGAADALAGAGRGGTATLADQWRDVHTPQPARWQAPAEVRDDTPGVQLGGATGARPPAPGTAAPAPVSGAGWSAGGPTVAYPAVDPLPKRTPGSEATPSALSAPPAYQPLAAPPTVETTPAAPVMARPDRPAEVPIFREMEAVWFRSHGEDETTIFTRPRFDEPPPAPAQPAASARPPLPTRTPGAQASGLTTPAAYSSPAVPVTPPAAAAPPAPAPIPTPTPGPAPEPAGAPVDADAWRTAADEGWNRASRAAEPTTGGTTRSGLPKRVPQAQLVPGGIEPKSGRDRSRRSPDEVRGLLSAYHRGVQRGRTAGTDLNSTSTKETNR